MFLFGRKKKAGVRGADPGDRTVLEGNETVIEGSQTVLEGNETVIEGSETVLEASEPKGSETVLEGNETVIEGSQTALEGNETVIEGSETVLEASEPKGSETVLERNEPAPEESETVLERNEPGPEGDRTVPEESRTAPGGGETLPEEGERTESKEPNPFPDGMLVLDTYRVLKGPMRGGMGSVWQVRHEAWNALLAMKQPLPKIFRSREDKERFTGECRYWINLGLHPNIVSCYYVRDIDGTPAVFSEWMEGGSLKDRIADRTLYAGSEREQEKRLLDIAIQFARGLRYAHEKGLIHQDVKPDNLLLGRNFAAKVSDFGLARARAAATVYEPASADAAPGLSMIRGSGGYTPAYCSMEQMNGEMITRRTDIYSWAVSVMEMYRGSRPWANGVVAGLGCESYLEGGAVPVPERLKGLLMQCLAAEAKDRPESFDSVEKELVSIYEEAFGEAYPRPAFEAALATAGSCNNRALSFLDLGNTEEAEKNWEEALSQDAGNADAVFNYVLSRFRRGFLSVEDAEDMLTAVRDEDMRRECIRRLEEEKGRLELTYRSFNMRLLDASKDGRITAGIEWDTYHMQGSPDFETDGYVYEVPDDEDGHQLQHGERILFEDTLSVTYGDSAGASIQDVMSLSADGRRVSIQFGDMGEEETVVFNLPASYKDLEDGELYSDSEEAIACRVELPGGRLSPDGKYIAFQLETEECEYDGVSFYCVDSGEEVGKVGDDYCFMGFFSDASPAFFHFDTRGIFLGKSPEDPLGAGTKRLEPIEDFVRSALIFPEDEKRCLLLAHRRCYLWDVPSGKRIAELEWGKDRKGSICKPVFGRFFGGDKQILVIFQVEEDEAQGRKHDGKNWNEILPGIFMHDHWMQGEEIYFVATVWDAADGKFVTAEEIPGENLPVGVHPQSVFAYMKTDRAVPAYTPGKRAGYRLSVIESTEERLAYGQQFEALMEKAQAALDAGDQSSALALADEALKVPGYETSAQALALRSRAASGMEKCGVERIVVLDETVQVSPENDPTIRNALQKEKLRRKKEARDARILQEIGDVLERLSAQLADAETGSEYARLHRTSALPVKGEFASGRKVTFVPENTDGSARLRLVRMIREEKRKERFMNADSRMYQEDDFAWHGALLVDLEKREIILRKDAIACTSRRDDRETMRKAFSFNNDWDFVYNPADCSYCPIQNRAVPVFMRLDRAGKRILAADLTLRIYETRGKNAFRTLPGKGPFLFADFLENDRYVMSLGADEVLRIIDTTDNSILIEHAFPQGEFGRLVPIDDDSFALERGEEMRLVRIVWKTGTRKPGTPAVPEKRQEAAKTAREMVQSGLSGQPAVFIGVGGDGCRFGTEFFREETSAFMRAASWNQSWYVGRENLVMELLAKEEGSLQDCIVPFPEISEKGLEAAYASAREIVRERAEVLGMFSEDLIVLTGHLGDPEGPVYLPALCEEAARRGRRTICFVSCPFGFEGAGKTALAEKAIEILARYADYLFVWDNDSLISGKMTMEKLMKMKRWGYTGTLLGFAGAPFWLDRRVFDLEMHRKGDPVPEKLSQRGAQCIADLAMDEEGEKVHYLVCLNPAEPG